MKIIIEGEVSDLGGIKLSKIEELYLVIRTEKSLVMRPVSPIEKISLGELA